MTQVESRESKATLYERVGGREGLYAIISGIVDAHLENALIHTRFEPFDRQTMKDQAFEFFAQATGGPVVYSGRDWRRTGA
jgi:hemoglobin